MVSGGHKPEWGTARKCGQLTAVLHIPNVLQGSGFHTNLEGSSGTLIIVIKVVTPLAWGLFRAQADIGWEYRIIIIDICDAFEKYLNQVSTEKGLLVL